MISVHKGICSQLKVSLSLQYLPSYILSLPHGHKCSRALTHSYTPILKCAGHVLGSSAWIKVKHEVFAEFVHSTMKSLAPKHSQLQSTLYVQHFFVEQCLFCRQFNTMREAAFLGDPHAIILDRIDNNLTWVNNCSQ